MFSEISSPYKHVLAFYLRNKNPTCLACNLKQVYAAILESLKNNDLLQKRQIYSHQILEISQNFFDIVSVRVEM